MVSTKTSRIMRKIHSKDTGIEIKLRKALYARGYRYRKNYKKLIGKPDIVLTKYRIAIFCDSEFFHGKNFVELHDKLIKGNNGKYWCEKISNNIERDRVVNESLKLQGWTVLRFWGKDIISHTDECLAAIDDAVFNAILETDSKI